MHYNPTLLSRRVWRRLERRALRGHDRDLQRHLRDLAGHRPAVLDTDASWMSGVVSLQLSGHRLVLGGVAASTAWDVLAMTLSPTSLRLTKAGRYGPFWWIAVKAAEERVILATHLQLHHDRGLAQQTKRDLPILSDAY